MKYGCHTRTVIEEFLKSKNGVLTRITISSDEYHKNNPYKAKSLLKFEDASTDSNLSLWEVTKGFIDVMFDLQPVENMAESITQSNGNTSSLSTFEQHLLTLMWFEGKYHHQLIASMFGVGRALVGLIIQAWSPLFGDVGCDMARLSLSKYFLDKS